MQHSPLVPGHNWDRLFVCKKFKDSFNQRHSNMVSKHFLMKVIDLLPIEAGQEFVCNREGDKDNGN